MGHGRIDRSILARVCRIPIVRSGGLYNIFEEGSQHPIPNNDLDFRKSTPTAQIVF